MPYEWIKTAPEDSGAVFHEAHLWPYRSLPKRGFVWFIGGTAILLMVPLLAVIGSPVLWGLLPFLLGVIWALWWALGRSYRDGELLEVLRLGPGLATLDRHQPDGTTLHWEANPYWVRARLHATGPVPSYLTLKGEGREVELGPFLTPEERRQLAAEVSAHLSDLRAAV